CFVCVRQKTAWEIGQGLELRRVLFRSAGRVLGVELALELDAEDAASAVDDATHVRALDEAGAGARRGQGERPEVGARLDLAVVGIGRGAWRQEREADVVGSGMDSTGRD